MAGQGFSKTNIKALRSEAKEKYARGKGDARLKGYSRMSRAELAARLGKGTDEKKENRSISSTKTAAAIAQKVVGGQTGDDKTVARVQAKARLLRSVKRELDAARKANPEISQDELRKVAGKAFVKEAQAIKAGKPEVKAVRGGQKKQDAPKNIDPTPQQLKEYEVGIKFAKQTSRISSELETAIDFMPEKQYKSMLKEMAQDRIAVSGDVPAWLNQNHARIVSGKIDQPKPKSQLESEIAELEATVTRQRESVKKRPNIADSLEANEARLKVRQQQLKEVDKAPANPPTVDRTRQGHPLTEHGKKTAKAALEAESKADPKFGKFLELHGTGKSDRELAAAVGVSKNVVDEYERKASRILESNPLAGRGHIRDRLKELGSSTTPDIRLEGGDIYTKPGKGDKAAVDEFISKRTQELKAEKQPNPEKERQKKLLGNKIKVALGAGITQLKKGVDSEGNPLSKEAHEAMGRKLKELHSRLKTLGQDGPEPKIPDYKPATVDKKPPIAAVKGGQVTAEKIHPTRAKLEQQARENPKLKELSAMYLSGASDKKIRDTLKLSQEEALQMTNGLRKTLGVSPMQGREGIKSKLAELYPESTTVLKADKTPKKPRITTMKPAPKDIYADAKLAARPRPTTYRGVSID